MRRMNRPFLVGLIALSVIAPSAWAQTTTISTWDFITDTDLASLLWSWGGEFNAGLLTETWAVGQTFHVQDNAQRLEHFSMRVPGGDNCDTFPHTECDLLYTMYLASWDPVAMSMGTVLWSSSPIAFNSSLSHIRASPRKLVNSGYYAALIIPYSAGPSVSPLYVGNIGPNLSWVGGGDDPSYTRYGGGSLVAYYGPPISDPNAPWTTVTDADLYFDAVVTTTPEPFTMLLLGGGLMGIGAARLRRRRSHPTRTSSRVELARRRPD